jgi:hypothetical protein
VRDKIKRHSKFPENVDFKIKAEMKSRVTWLITINGMGIFKLKRTTFRMSVCSFKRCNVESE